MQYVKGIRLNNMLKVINEESIIEQSFQLFVKAVKDYELFDGLNQIAVLVSNDRNSLFLLSCLERWNASQEAPVKIVYFVEREALQYKELMNVILERFGIHKYQILEEKSAEYLYKTIREYGCDRVILPQNRTDIICLSITEFVKRKEPVTIQPVYQSNYMSNVTFIRPLCLIDDQLVGEWTKESKVTYCKQAGIFDLFLTYEEDVKQDFFRKHFDLAVYE